MRRLGLALLSTTALAAMAVPVQAAPPAPFSWTGFYIGGNVGYSWGRAKVTGDVAGLDVDTGVIGIGTISIPGADIDDKVKLNGWIGGGQIGYNWQTAPNWLWGLEADIQGSGEKGSGRSSSSFDFAVGDGEGAVGSINTRYDAKISWFGTARVRAGWIMDNSLMLYGTGGLAYGKVSLSGKTTTDVFVEDCDFCFSDTFSSSFSGSKVKAGWTAGVGIEGTLWDPRWTWRAEYLYLDLGKLKVNDNGANLEAKFTDNIVRFGLNFRP
jgi:outer membrane immunogenic protein